MRRLLDEHELALWLKHHRRYMKRVRAGAAKRKGIDLDGAIPTRPGEALIETVRAARAGNAPRETLPSERFLRHVELTKAKRLGRRVTSLPVPEPEPIP